MSQSYDIYEITQKDARFPRLLKEIQNPPQRFFIRGIFPESPLYVSIVGTRKATYEGRELAKQIARQLAEKDIVVVSGLALGIDAAAHEGALAGNGKTIAVLANGLDTIYPRQHEHLAQKILASGGGIISEYPIGTPALPHQFLERNRIVSGISHATIVIEAPLRSGSIVTARTAAEQGRDVFVFPGPIQNVNYKGSHQLIRNGARLVSSFDDIIEDISELINEYHIEKNRLPIYQHTTVPESLNEEETIIMNILKKAGTPLSVDNIVESTTLESNVVRQHLTFLLLDGHIKEQGGFFSSS
ncbi:MAG: DNA-processing protein DprA [Patescibacteria group bacterium]